MKKYHDKGPIKEYYNFFHFLWDYYNGKIKYGEPVKINENKVKETNDYDYDKYKLWTGKRDIKPKRIEINYTAKRFSSRDFKHKILNYNCSIDEYFKLPDVLIVNQEKFYKSDITYEYQNLGSFEKIIDFNYVQTI